MDYCKENYLSLPLLAYFNRNWMDVIFLLSGLNVKESILHSILNRINLLDTRHNWKVERKDK